MGFERTNIQKPNFRKVSDYTWEVDKSFKAGMRVPARVYASRKILDGMDLQVYDQLTNVATLPGIVNYALCMPDGHSGYGFPIGGVAAFDAEEGVISPGGIGFDINCLTGKTRVLTERGYKPIEKYELGEKIATKTGERLVYAEPSTFMKKRANAVIEIKTENGRKILSTPDHPILTDAGFVKASEISEEKLVSTFEDGKFGFELVEETAQKVFADYVYDFTMPKTHNFIAEGIVTHNCGMRLVRTDLTEAEVRPKLKELIELLFKSVPAGVGSEGFVKLTAPEFRKVIMEGSEWCVEKGYGWKEDLKFTEENGRCEDADEKKVSDMAVKRGRNQIGTLGSGNHYLEIQVVKEENIFEKEAAKAYGIFPGQVVVMFHCGSRGFGHQVATDYLQTFLNVMEGKYGIKILDRELACAPFHSPEGQSYFAAMKCALNMSFANRQVILHRIRECFSSVFKKTPEALGMRQVYDVAHNTAKLEEYEVEGKRRKVLVHRKGATRSFGPGLPEVPAEYRSIGQPVIIGGSMETGSYLLAGTEGAMKQTWGSTAHGSGRTMSRTQAKGMFRGDKLQKDMEARGILIRTTSFAGLAEEAGAAYKDIDEVIDACHNAGISKKVVKLLPLGNIKG